MKLKKTLSILLLTSTVACFKVPAGNVGVKVDLFGKDKGVQTKALGVGRYWKGLGINADYYLFPTYTQNYKWIKNDNPKYDESIKFQSKQQVDLNADINITYSLDETKITTLFQKYRDGIEEITDKYLRTMVNDAFIKFSCKLSVQEINEQKEELRLNVQNYVSEQVNNLGIKIEKISYLSKIRVPKSVEESINAKIRATQRAQERENEVRSAIADTKIAREKGKQDKIRGQALKNNPELMRKKELEVQQQFIEKWNGIMPTHILGTNSLMTIGQ